MKKRRGFQMFIYEEKCILGNVFSIMFGLVFPIFMLLFLGKIGFSDVPSDVLPKMHTQLYITMATIIPLAIMFIGYAANYAQELEMKIPLRLQLFGILPRQTLVYRLLAYLVCVTVCLAVYTVVAAMYMEIRWASPGRLAVSLLCFYLLSVVCLIASHSIAYAIQKFGPAYGITMVLYFGIMIVSGMMGVRQEQLPKGVVVVAKLLPTYHFGYRYINFWMGKSYNAAPLIQSFVFSFALAILLFMGSVSLRRKKGMV